MTLGAGTDRGKDLFGQSGLTVNVAGSRESKSPGIQERVGRIILTNLDEMVGGEL